MEESGLEVAVEAFSYDMRPVWRALRTLLVVAGLALGAAGWLALSAPLIAAGLTLAALLSGGTLLVWAPGLERLYQRDGPTETANVVAYRRAERPRLSLVLLAHHDSKSQNLPMLVRGSLSVIAAACACVLAALLAVASAGSAVPGPTWLAPALGSGAGAALLVLSSLRSGNLSPGGVDNAGSVGLLLELARRLPEVLADDVTLVFLSPGAEEDHMIGAMRWLDRHLPELGAGPLWALNFDGVGIPGRLVLLERFGLGRRFAPALSALARRSAARLDIRLRGVLLPPAMGIDAIPFVHRGVDCLTLASGSLCAAALAVHSVHDHAANLDGAALGEAARLAEAMALELANQGDAAAGPEL